MHTRKLLAMVGAGLFPLKWASVRARAGAVAVPQRRELRDASTFRFALDELPPSMSFAFDGTHSDIAQQLYARHNAGDTLEKVIINSVPDAVKNRLDALGISFSNLPGLLQRAVLWDTGFALSRTHDAVQIWPLGSYTMADLAVPMQDVAQAGCTFLNCTQPNDATAHYTRYCTGDQILALSRCVADEFEDDGDAFLMMWSKGGNPDMTPQIDIVNHAWRDPRSDDSYSVYAIHTLVAEDAPPFGHCPADEGYGSLTIPCHTRSEYSHAEIAAMAKPQGSSWVTTWLKQFTEQNAAAKEDSGFGTVLLVPIFVGALMVIGVGVGYFLWRRKSRASYRESPSENYDQSTTPVCIMNSTTPEQPRWHSMSTQLNTGSDTSRSSFPSSLLEDYASIGSSDILKTLLESESLLGRRIPFEDLHFEKALSKGASGEVWMCELAGQKVAAKRLLQIKDQKVEDVQCFAKEIELNASLVHPNIVSFIGVTWNSLSNLIMVLEYFPLGDLQKFLNRKERLLSWSAEKMDMAVGIARALAYIHARTPPLIHRDLKSKNILLTDKLEAKIIDFGISRTCKDNTMTSGVGTPYWTAPEILEGTKYTEQADIYSFGVVLSELDTCNTPYYDAVTESGTKQKPFQILQAVLEGVLRPSFSNDCPELIRRVGTACCQHNASQRPSALELVQMLTSASVL